MDKLTLPQAEAHLQSPSPMAIEHTPTDSPNTALTPLRITQWVALLPTMVRRLLGIRVS